MVDIKDGNLVGQPEPGECKFGIMHYGDDERFIFLSVPENDAGKIVMDGEYAYDNFRRGDVKVAPEWFPAFEDCECMFAIPDQVSLVQAKADMIALGYRHDPEWDDEDLVEVEE